MSNLASKFILANRFIFDSTSNLLVDQTGEEETRLGSNESRILSMFVQHPNQIISRDDLHNYVWREQGFEVDDSSLTQAISTLRKMLKDSTKLPLFIKTVPKRGYQFIASVEPIVPPEPVIAEPEIALENSAANQDESAFSGDSHTDLTGKSNDRFMGTKDTVSAKRLSDLCSLAMLACAILLPIMVLFFSSPSSSQFRQLAVVNNVVISSPINHPDLSTWLPLIKSCIKKHHSMRSDDMILKEVIATGGDNGQLILNYIHLPQFSGENITLRIFANPDDTDKVCQ
ncbi:winged helix-turn-helix domain-containing protein [Vibrio metschnikovii]|uniref:winged helix-turn-helix domain-containing protein n=1 Tax=Vibrio metschnikovii TaxID=28172 RepID=UPI001C2F759C|nr:transcriptional regulator [Vibrio metschnikovii]